MAKPFNGLLIQNLKSFVFHFCSTHPPIFPNQTVLSLNYMKVRRLPTNFRCHRLDVRGHFRKAVHRRTRAPDAVDEGARMTSLKGGRLSAGCDVTRAGQSAVRSPGGRGHAESPVSSRAGAGPERVSEAKSKQAGDPPFPSCSGASRSRPEPAAPARLRASGGRAPAPGSRTGRGGRDGAARAARLDGRRRSRRPAPSILSLPQPAARGAPGGRAAGSRLR